MRDPLHRLPVRHKLALTFVALCLLAFGVGGYLVSVQARSALESAIVARVDGRCRDLARALDAEMRLLRRRLDDFASDGYIRERIEAIARDPSGPDAERLGGELRRHLRVNKLPLVPAFLDLAAATPDGRTAVSVREAPSAPLADAASAAREEGWAGGVLPASEADAFPTTALAVPVRSLDGTREAGRLVARVHPGVWLATALRDAGVHGEASEGTLALELLDGEGRRLLVPAAWVAADPPAPDSEIVRTGYGLRSAGPAEVSAGPLAAAPQVLDATYPVSANGWTVRVQVDAARALEPVSGLQSRFVAVGLVLAAAAAALCFFPMRFVARPLVELREAARRLQRGDTAARVPEPGSDDEIGELARSFNVMADAVATRTRRLEEAAKDLEREKDRLAAVIASMRDGLVVLDESGETVHANLAARPLLDLLARKDPRVTSHYACGAAAAATCAGCLLDPARPARSCVVDAADRVLEIHAAPLAPGADGRAGRVLVARDITERVRGDERQIHQERLSVLGEVAAVVAHELNNPLAAIRMYAQMARDGLPGDSPWREHLDVIRRNTDACNRTIRELLDYATGSAPEIGEIELHAVLADVARFLRPLADRSGATIAVEARAARDLVAGDEIQVRQVFVNLVMNALQAMGRAGGEVRLATGNEGEHVFVDVTDTGPGIPPESQERVFDAFYTTKPRGQGTGLGLPTARRIAELHGGGLDLLASAPGRTTFRVRLRCAAVPAEVRA